MSREKPPSPARCPSCRGELVLHEWGLRGSACRNCQLYYPSQEERAETRAMFQQWRHLLVLVAELHQLGYECARVVPWIENTPGGGDWHCLIVPATRISPSHGARIDEAIGWWGGACPPGEGFPYYIGRGWRGMPGWPPDFDSAEKLIKAYPKLAEQCIGPDRDYVDWYRNMLQGTEPDGVIYGAACWDDKDAPTNRMRVIDAEGELGVLMPLPPPGKGCAIREARAIHEVSTRITRETVGRIVAGMAFSEVRDMLGNGKVLQKGESVQRSVGEASVQITTAVLEWQEGDRWITITFQNDKVVEKHHSGLE